VFVMIGKMFLPLVQPLGLCMLVWLWAAASWWRGRPRRAAALACSGIIGLLALASMPVGTALLRSLEDDFAPVAAEVAPAADAIVVMGGVTSPAVPPRLDVDVGDGFDRLLHGVRLWRAGKAPVIILSGGAIARLEGSDVTEASRLQRLALEYGVRPDALLLEERSRTTRENALYVAELATRRGIRRVLLVTSAAHMRRSLGAFRAVGLEAIPAPTDIRVVAVPFQPGVVLPSLDALGYSTRALKEYVGWWVYRARGWVR
jgi:uncharacterized SAM-binding protein YcdF (DUF218 family)